jgi:hypothetical protein
MPDLSGDGAIQEGQSGEQRGLIEQGDDSKACPFCGEVIKRVAVKCKHCGERLDGEMVSAARQPARPVMTQTGEGRFHFSGSYQSALALVRAAFRDCNTTIKEESAAGGLIRGQCAYGLNPFGITVTASFFASHGETGMELTANLTDAFDTFGVCRKKVAEISSRLAELAEARATPSAVPQPTATGSGSPFDFDAKGPEDGGELLDLPPSYRRRSGPSHRGKALTGCCFAVLGWCFPPAAILGLIFCSQALTAIATSKNQAGKGWANAGLILGLIALIPWALYLLSRF